MADDAQKKGRFMILRGKGKRKSEFKFRLLAESPNNTDISPRDFYKNHTDVLDLHKNYYSSFELVDKTGIKPKEASVDEHTDAGDKTSSDESSSITEPVQ